MKTVNRYTRAGKHGKVITCPKCYESYPVYHFAWSALVCTCCKETIQTVSYTHLRAHETLRYLVCRLLL